MVLMVPFQCERLKHPGLGSTEGPGADAAQHQQTWEVRPFCLQSWPSDPTQKSSGYDSASVVSSLVLRPAQQIREHTRAGQGPGRGSLLHIPLLQDIQ